MLHETGSGMIQGGGGDPLDGESAYSAFCMLGATSTISPRFVNGKSVEDVLIREYDTVMGFYLARRSAVKKIV